MIFTLIMNFRTSRGSKYTISLEDVDPLITNVDVNKLMDTIINLNIFYNTSKGILSSKLSSSLIATSSADFKID